MCIALLLPSIVITGKAIKWTRDFPQSVGGVVEHDGRSREARMDFLRDETGQDLTEYALLLAFVVIASAALLLVNMTSIAGIWTSGNQVIASGNSLAKTATS